jgi:hypothetical protein
VSERQLSLFGKKRPRPARARDTDPVTSHEAAESVSQASMTRTRERILLILQTRRSLSDLGIWDAWQRKWWQEAGQSQISPSGLRTRRSELVRLGLIRDSGQYEILPSGRRAILWELVPQ